MTNYAEKKVEALDNITYIIGKLDDNLSKIEEIEMTEKKKHSVKKWYEEKKAVHEIKRILHNIGKYEKYDDKELEGFKKDYSDVID